MKFSDFLKKLKTKYLCSNKGASIILSLVIFLAAAMVSLVIVNAALTNAQRIQAQKNHEQDYLMLSSSASMLKNMLVGCGVEVNTISYREYDNKNNEWGKVVTEPVHEVAFKANEDAAAPVVPENIKEQLMAMINDSITDDSLIIKPDFVTKKYFSTEITLTGAVGVLPIKTDWYLENKKDVYTIIVILKTEADDDARKGKIGYNNVASFQTVIFEIGKPRSTQKTEHVNAGAADERLVTKNTKLYSLESCIVSSGLDIDNEEIRNNY